MRSRHMAIRFGTAFATPEGSYRCAVQTVGPPTDLCADPFDDVKLILSGNGAATPRHRAIP